MTAPRLAHQPALDGVRAVAVTTVLLFHGGVGWMRGGYIGVSIFFTLSGYLITSLLLAESDVSGGVRVGAFLARRARRLLPASAVCITGVALCSRYGLLDGVAHLERDLLGAALQVQNWVLLGSGESYTEVLATAGGQASPLEHYWSLAIEEQFYWVWPVVFGWLAIHNRDRLTRRLGGMALAAVVAAPLIAVTWGRDAAYWATPARLAEILIGAWLAAALAGRRLGGRWAHVAPASLGVLLIGAAVLPSGGGPMYAGGLPLVALASAMLIASLQVPGPVRDLLARRVFVGLGRISYGLYLYHWPVYVILDDARTGLSGASLLGLRIAVSVGCAVGSYVLIERPIRNAAWRPRPTLVGAALATSAIAVVAVAVPVTIDDEYWRVPAGQVTVLAAAAPSPGRGAAPLEEVTTTTAPGPVRTAPSPLDGAVLGPVPSTTPSTMPSITTPAPEPRAVGPVRILVVGDSTAEALGGGLVGWAAANPHLADVRLAVSPGCGFVRGGEVSSDEDVPFGARCDEILERVVPNTLTEFRPEVVMLLSTSRDLLDRRWSDDEGTLDPFDARYRRRLDRDYARIADLVTASGATALFVRSPLVDPYWLGRETMFNEPRRRAVVDDVMARLADPGGAVRILDLRAWVEGNGLAASHDARPDGVHWAPETAVHLADQWLGPILLSIARTT